MFKSEKNEQLFYICIFFLNKVYDNSFFYHETHVNLHGYILKSVIFFMTRSASVSLNANLEGTQRFFLPQTLFRVL